MKFKKLQKVRLSSDYGLSIGTKEHRKFAGKEAVILDVNGDELTLAVDHDGDPITPAIQITVKTKYVEILSFLWQMWLMIRGLFKK